MARNEGLKKNWLHVLTSLAGEPRHGYAIMVEVTERTSGRVRLWPATLYATLKELDKAGYIERVPGADPDADARRRTYALTPEGAAALDAETDRLQELVDLVRARRSAG